MATLMGDGHQHLATIKAHHVARMELAATAGFDGVIDAHIAALNALLGLAASGGQPLPFEELIKLQEGRGHGPAPA
jgi:hypothetical protein